MPFDSWPNQASFFAIFDSLYLVAVTAHLIKCLKVCFHVNDDNNRRTNHIPLAHAHRVIIRLEEDGWALSFTVEMR